MRDYIHELTELINNNLRIDPHFYDEFIPVSIDKAALAERVRFKRPIISPPDFVVTGIYKSLNCPGCGHSKSSHGLRSCSECHYFCGYIVSEDNG